MAIVLASKPGLSSTTTLAIPKDWSSSWFRGLITNQLQGGDVRNAVGANGITVSGNIASPYATISFGPGPIVLTSPSGTVPLTINATAANALVINAAPGNFGIRVNSAAGASGAYGIVTVGSTTTNQSFGLFAQAGTSASDFAMKLVNQANSQTLFAVQGTGSSNSLAIAGWGNTAGSVVDMSPDTGSFTATATGITGSPTGTAVWAKMGNVVILSLPAITANTSTAATFTLTGLPSEIQPTRTWNIPINFAEDNGAGTAGTAQINNASGTITLFKGIATTGSSWTASGNKGLLAQNTMVYGLN